MKKVAFLLCGSSLLGLVSPLSFFSEANLKKGVGMLESGAADFFFVSTDGFDFDECDAAINHVQKIIDALNPKIAAKIKFSHSSKSFENSFLDFVSGISDEIAVTVLGGIGERICLKLKINESILSCPENKYMNRRIPPVLMM